MMSYKYWLNVAGVFSAVLVLLSFFIGFYLDENPGYCRWDKFSLRCGDPVSGFLLNCFHPFIAAVVAIVTIGSFIKGTLGILHFLAFCAMMIPYVLILRLLFVVVFNTIRKAVSRYITPWISAAIIERRYSYLDKKYGDLGPLKESDEYSLAKEGDT